ncbi:MAG: hypothetical protein F9B45_29595 [Phycisphaera sp. RhM]|nr:hypothetical protein [Phycisphaera sp. RhM]
MIAQFDFEGNDYVAEPSNTPGFNTGLNLSSGASVLGTSVGQLQFSPGLDPTAALGNWADHYDNALGFSTDVNNDRDFLTADQTVFFQVEVQSGFLLDLESFRFDTLKTRGTNTDDARLTYSVFLNPAGDPSVDGLIGDFDFLPNGNGAHDHFADGVAGAETTGPSFSTGRHAVGPIDLSANQNLTGTQTIAIRLYGSAGNGNDQDFGIDSLVLRGQVTAIPEPACTVVLLLGIAASTCRRRRSNAI